VEIQAIAGLGVHRLNADNDFIRSSEYRLLFEQAFPDIEADRRYTAEFVGLAIAAYERTVMANESRWQKYLRGNTFALDEVEKFGAELFFSKAECSGCHNGPALSAMEFKAIGMADLVDCPEPTLKTTADNVENLGRGGFTQREDELYQYKVPTIYNLKDSPFYGHGSSLRSIKAVIEYKNKAIPEKAETIDYLDNRFRPLGLTAEEVDALTRFVRDALYDSDLDRYLPDRLPSGLCFPNNDKLSKDDLGCS
jgi:cytochrome c peroxidase